MSDLRTTRRSLLARGGLLASAFALAGCDRIIASDTAQSTFKRIDGLTRDAQEALLDRQQLAPEYKASDISKMFYANGNTDPGTDEYAALAKGGFSAYKLEVAGLVETPLTLTLDDLRKSYPSRTQITRHDCVEGWSCIGQWAGTPLSAVLDKAGVKPQAKYVLFRCFDSMDDPNSLSGDKVPFYGTIDLLAARHPQTILAYDMNEKPLEVRYGAPLRLRVERQLGYKMNKYIKRIELIDDFSEEGSGKGGYWEDNGYQWYAGI